MNLRDEDTGKPVESPVSPFPNFDKPKTLTTFTLAAVIYASSISGGYGLEGSIQAGGPMLTIVFLFLIPFLWGLPISYCVAELACCIPSNAGVLMWVHCAFRPWVTLCTVMWTVLLIFVDNSIYPTLFADYCAVFLSIGPWTKIFVKIVFVWVCAFVNIVGMRIVGVFSLFIMIITILPFTIMFPIQLVEGIDWRKVAHVPSVVDWSLFLPILAWNYSGFDSAGHVVEEVVVPERTLLRSLVFVVVAGLCTYIPPILIGCSATGTKEIPFSEWHDGFWVQVGRAVGGEIGAAVVMFGGTVSTLGLMTTLVATSSRSLAGMGNLRMFPCGISQWISRYHPVKGTPVNAIVLNCAITSAVAACMNFEALVTIDQVLYALRLMLIVGCFVQLRTKFPELPRSFRVPWGTFGACVVAGLSMVSSAILLITTMMGTVALFNVSMIVIVSSVALSLAITFLSPTDIDVTPVAEVI